MRSPSEIKQAISYLKGKGGRTAEEQIKVLKANMTESQVFHAYVVNVSEDNKDESLYFAAREAAQYLAGRLTIEELIPEYETVTPVKSGSEQTTGITMSEEAFATLMKRLDEQEKRIRQLESWVNPVREARPLPPGTGINDMYNQAAARKYLGISRDRIKRYIKIGMLKAYLYGRNVYYSKSDVEKLKSEM